MKSHVFRAETLADKGECKQLGYADHRTCASVTGNLSLPREVWQRLLGPQVPELVHKLAGHSAAGPTGNWVQHVQSGLGRTSRWTAASFQPRSGYPVLTRNMNLLRNTGFVSALTRQASMSKMCKHSSEGWRRRRAERWSEHNTVF